MIELVPRDDPDLSGTMIFDLNARPLFEQARHRAQIYHLISAVTGKPRDLMGFDEHAVHALMHNAKFTTASVPISHIRGSVNRLHEFDCYFYPLTDDVEMRWLRIASMMLQGKSLELVELIRVGRTYFVIDGHHRISVSRMMGLAYVDALVQSIEI